MADSANDCLDCPPGMVEGVPEVCPSSKRPCGHHCNHSWSHDVCCWCGQEWGES